jgi:hypothetical protein
MRTWLYDLRYRTDCVELACLVTAWFVLILTSLSGGH